MTTPFYITQLLYLTIHRIMSIYMVNITHGIEAVTRYVTVHTGMQNILYMERWTARLRMLIATA